MPASPQQTAESRANWREGWDKIDWTGTRPKQQGAVYRVVAKPLGTVIDVPAPDKSANGTELIVVQHPESDDQ